MQDTKEELNSLKLNINYTKTYQLDFTTKNSHQPQQITNKKLEKNSWDCN